MTEEEEEVCQSMPRAEEFVDAQEESVDDQEEEEESRPEEYVLIEAAGEETRVLRTEEDVKLVLEGWRRRHW